MPIRNSNPEFFQPIGLQDGFDQSYSFKGACRALQNLVFDQANARFVVARPGVRLAVDFSVTGGWSTPADISVGLVVGTRVYGMIATARNAGFEEPFCYETATGAFIAIAGVTANNVPTNAGTTGQWNPPTMAQIAKKIIVTHPGFDGNVPNTRFFGVIDITNPAAPAWSSQNTTVNALTAPPVAVANFNNRAYYAVGNALILTDVLLPTVVTNASQVLTIDDSSSVTALAPLPVGTSTQGIIAALLVFKGAAESTWQVTGDPALTTLAIQQLSNNIGCWSPRSIVATPEGVKFMGVDGIYVVSLLGVITPLLNNQQNQNPDLQDPFIQATQAQASRAAASYNQGVYRLSLATTINGIAQTNDYWFDEHSRRWNGPHSFNYTWAGSIGDQFALVSKDFPARLFFSVPAQHLASAYTDQTAAAVEVSYQCTLLSALMPNRGDMSMNAIIESEIDVGRSSASSQYTVQAQDEFGSAIDTTTLTITSNAPLWNTLNWNTHNWASPYPVSQVLPIPWTQPIVFKRMQVQVYAQAGVGVAIGTFAMRWQKLGYMNKAA